MSDLLISAFPYAGFLAIELIESVNEDNVGRYAGLIASSFMLGRALTSIFWGRVADVYGRVTVLQISLLLSCVFSLLFGVVSTFAGALAIRFLLGLSNGLLLSVKTMVSELAHGDEKREAKMMSLVLAMWGVGFLVSPAISGVLAEPHKQYPEKAWLQDGLFGATLEHYPFILPNILGSALCLVCICLVQCFVPETLESKRSPRFMCTDAISWFRSFQGSRVEYSPLSKEKESYPEQVDTDDEEDGVTDESLNVEQVTLDESASFGSIWRSRRSRRLLLAYWVFSFLSLVVDETFPLFCMSSKAGLGISEKEIGKILSLCGFLFLLLQHPVNTFVYDQVGLLGSLRTGCAFAYPLLLLVPISVLLNAGADTVKLSTFVFLGGTLSVSRVFSFIFFTNVSVMINRSVPATQRATVNGLSNLGGSAAKGMGPLAAGLLTSQSVPLFGAVASLVIFGSIVAFGSALAVCVYYGLDGESDAEESTDELELTGSRSNQA